MHDISATRWCHALLQNKSPHKLATLLISGQHEMVSAYLKKVIIWFPTVFFIGSFQVEYNIKGQVATKQLNMLQNPMRTTEIPNESDWLVESALM